MFWYNVVCIVNTVILYPFIHWNIIDFCSEDTFVIGTEQTDAPFLANMQEMYLNKNELPRFPR